MAWTAPRTWVANQILTAAQLNEQIRDNFNELDAAKITQAGDYIVATGPNAITARRYAFDRIDGNGTRELSTYGDLSTGTGPSVTLTTGTKAVVFFGSYFHSSAADAHMKVSYAISGATTSSSLDARALVLDGLPGNNGPRFSTIDLRTDLTSGSNTFTMQYASDGVATMTCQWRFLFVFPL